MHSSPVDEEDIRKRILELDGAQTDTVEFYATYLTGEHPDSPIRTRQSNSEGGLMAAEWIRDQLEGFGFHVDFWRYNISYGRGRDLVWNPVVVAEWPGSGLESDELVVVGAHYDDRQRPMWNSEARAPGANDDGL
jgi:hypothetical protein